MSVDFRVRVFGIFVFCEERLVVDGSRQTAASLFVRLLLPETATLIALCVIVIVVVVVGGGGVLSVVSVVSVLSLCVRVFMRV